MASQAATVELWSGLEPAGGTKQAVITTRSKLIETNREDGNDQCDLAFPLSNPIAASVANGWAVRIIGEDGTIREYLVYIITDDVLADTCELTCAGARSWLGTPTTTTAYSQVNGAPNTMANAIASMDGFPVWLSLAGWGITPAIYTFSIAVGDNILAALVRAVGVISAGLADGVAPAVSDFVPTVSSGKVTAYVATLRTAPPAGTAHLVGTANSNKNILQLQRRRDTTNPTFPLTGYAVQVADLYRDQPATYPNDNLLPYQTCRLEYPPLSIDVTTRIVAVTTDHGNTLGTTVELGTPRRRLQQTVSTLVTAVTPVTAVTGWLNKDIAAAAAIAYSKLNLANSIVNADVAAGAAIAYAKLALTGAILNADLAGSIAYAKLALTGAILNADLAGSIAYAKLALTGAILNADLAGSIADSKLLTIATAGKVANTATTAVSTNTPSTILLRDAGGNFSAGAVTVTGLVVGSTQVVGGRVTGFAPTWNAVYASNKNASLGPLGTPANFAQCATAVDITALGAMVHAMYDAMFTSHGLIGT